MPRHPIMINAANNTDSSITGFRGQSSIPYGYDRYIRHLKIDDDDFEKFYKKMQLIGKGNYGIVYEVRNSKNNSQWAMKIIHKRTLPANHMKAVEREINILKLLRHPHIIQLKEVYESAANIYLILEKCEYDLTYLCKKEKTFSSTDARRIINDLASAVSYLHKNDIVHRDIKLDNVLVTINPEDQSDKLYIKLSDFGLSIIKAGRGFTDMLHEKCGTLYYMAPEILLSESYSQQCDVWAIGVILYILLTGKLPFPGNRDSIIITNICKVDPNYKLLEDRPPECIDLLKRILNKNPAERITASEMLAHPWLKGKALSTMVSTHNVLDMMRKYNYENKVSPDSDTQLTHRNAESSRKSKQRQTLPLSVQNLAFDKRKSRGEKTNSRRGEKGNGFRASEQR